MDKSRKVSHEDILAFCDEISSDDGLSQLEWERRNRDQKSRCSGRDRYRQSQLGKQILLGIDDAFCCNCYDSLLSDLRCIEVRPSNGGSYLAVIMTPESDPQILISIHEKLVSASGLIRASVAAVINRKRVPYIGFRVISEFR